jgi:hypothetical protein
MNKLSRFQKTSFNFLLLFLVFFFIYGFVIGENSAGGGGYNGDFQTTFKNLQLFVNNNFLEGCNDLFKNIYDIYDTFITYLKEYIPVVVINELRTKLKQYKEGPCLNYFIYDISSTIDKYDYLINTTNVLCVHNKHLKKALVKARSMDRIIHNTLEEDILTIERLIYTFVNNRPLIIWTPNLSHHNTFFDIIRRECDNKKFRAKVIKTFNSDIYPKL